MNTNLIFGFILLIAAVQMLQIKKGVGTFGKNMTQLIVCLFIGLGGLAKDILISFMQWFFFFAVSFMAIFSLWEFMDIIQLKIKVDDTILGEQDLKERKQKYKLAIVGFITFTLAFFGLLLVLCGLW